MSTTEKEENNPDQCDADYNFDIGDNDVANHGDVR
jgi:hypothetical protein